MKYFLYKLLLSIGLLMIALPAFAQSTFLPNQVELSISPSTPRPGETVTVVARSSTVDLDRAQMNWTVSGKGVASGIGIKSIKFTAGQAGSATSIHLFVAGADGRQFSVDGRVTPSAVDLLWQAQSYTPPWYEGRALLGPNSQIIVSAITTGASGNTVLAPGNLIYTWKKGTTVLGDLSGRGKDHITIVGPSVGGEIEISVMVTNGSGQLVGQGTTIIDSVDPYITLYQNDPLLGINFAQALSQVFTLNAREIALTAVPYFFATNARTASLTYHWTIDGKGAESMPGDAGTIILRQSGAVGESSVGISVDHTNNLLQTAATSLLVQLGGNH